MRTLAGGGLNVVVTGGTDRQGGGTGPLVVLLHGFGAPGEDLVPLAHALKLREDVRFAFPSGPLDLAGPLGFGVPARAWWHIDIPGYQRAAATGQLDRLTETIPEGVAEAVTKLGPCLEFLCSTLAVPEGQLVLGGFSQGAMLALHAALALRLPLAGIALLSSGLIGRRRWAEQLSTRGEVPLFQSHGHQDPILPFAVGLALHELLTTSGWNPTFVPFPGGHEIPASVLAQLETFLRRVLSRPAEVREAP